jgi:hypothetical protein
VDQVKKVCKLTDSLTCDEYATCVQTTAYTKNAVAGCTSDWLDKNCSDFKPGPGKGTTTGSTYTWTGEYFKISAQGGGGIQASLPDVDLSVVNKVVLELDFSSQYAHNDTGSEITFSMNLGKTAGQLVSEYSSIQVIPPAGIKNLTPNPGDAKGGAVILGSVILGDSIINPGRSVNFTFNTDTNLKGKKETFTLIFNKKS